MEVGGTTERPDGCGRVSMLLGRLLVTEERVVEMDQVEVEVEVEVVVMIEVEVEVQVG